MRYISDFTDYEKNNFIGEVNYFIDKIKASSYVLENVEYTGSFDPNNCFDMINVLHFYLIEGRKVGERDDVFKRYTNQSIDISRKHFLKPSGNAGRTLCIREEWLLLLTKLSIKSKGKVKLNELWKEFERRGIYFDKFSRERIVEYFEKINLLEKKSDSGDAQYVRSVL